MSENNHKSLIEQLKDTVESFRERSTVGRVGTEHAIFIPSEILDYPDTDRFIKVAKSINEKPDWGLPVEIEKFTTSGVEGLNFVFKFSSSTEFDSVIYYLHSIITN